VQGSREKPRGVSELRRTSLSLQAVGTLGERTASPTPSEKKKKGDKKKGKNNSPKFKEFANSGPLTPQKKGGPGGCLGKEKSGGGGPQTCTPTQKKKKKEKKKKNPKKNHNFKKTVGVWVFFCVVGPTSVPAHVSPRRACTTERRKGVGIRRPHEQLSDRKSKLRGSCIQTGQKNRTVTFPKLAGSGVVVGGKATTGPGRLGGKEN